MQIVPQVLILLPTIVRLTQANKANVCKNSIDYFYIDNSPNCWYNPYVNATLEEMVLGRGYPLETYRITSRDGYITKLFRMPQLKKQKKGVVYLLHPATVTSSVWVDKGRDRSLAFLLHDAGFDVWLGNLRGSDYGKEHVTLTEKDPEYWDFGFHEMAIYDLPKSLEFIKNATGSKIAFAGHSMGGTAAYVYASMLPDHAVKHVNVFVLLSAGGFFKDVKLFLIDFLSQLVYFGTNILKSINYLRIVSKEDWLARMFINLCKTPVGYNICPLVGKVLVGITDTVWDPAHIPVIFTQYPGGVPLKAYFHYGQWLSSRNMLYRMFDYGKYKNRIVYKSFVPPKYPFHAIRSPIYLVYAKNDWLSTPEGTEEFYDMLPNEAKIYGKRMLEEYNHADALLSETAVEDIYRPLIKFFEMIFSNATNIY